ncbi:MAG: hypothetical protein NUW21_01830, partial [Elusimicrobia bacterium]|nr:hypothetical protein [Elusimicrobiota bacterium]
MPRPIALLLAAVLLSAGCRMAGKLVKGTVKTTAKVTYGTAKIATKVAYSTAVVAGGLIKDFGYYAARKAFYEKHHDAGDLPSSPVRPVVGRRYPKLPVYKGGYRWP